MFVFWYIKANGVEDFWGYHWYNSPLMGHSLLRFRRRPRENWWCRTRGPWLWRPTWGKRSRAAWAKRRSGMEWRSVLCWIGWGGWLICRLGQLVDLQGGWWLVCKMLWGFTVEHMGRLDVMGWRSMTLNNDISVKFQCCLTTKGAKELLCIWTSRKYRAQFYWVQWNRPPTPWSLIRGWLAHGSLKRWNSSATQ